MSYKLSARLSPINYSHSTFMSEMDLSSDRIFLSDERLRECCNNCHLPGYNVRGAENIEKYFTNYNQQCY